ncbi:MAG: Gx transporter family protein [Candidatus Omnitrophica bacterium]|nr:Gx transporter family protein [Candidatus Omnitrophota bacterium]
MNESAIDKKTYKIALLVAISCVLQIAESLIPHPIPGLRLGLANIVVLISLVTLGVRPAIEIAVLRTILSAFIMGTFMSPTFILSFFGALISTLIMGGIYLLSQARHPLRLSIIGISIIGALVHNITQLYLAYFILVKHSGIFAFFGWLCIGSVIMGWITGLVAGSVCRKLEEFQGQTAVLEILQADNASAFRSHYIQGESFLHLLSGEIKIGGMIIISMAVLAFSNFWFYAVLFLFLVLSGFFSHIPFTLILSRVKKYSSLIIAAFLLPLFFNSGTQVLYQIGYFKLTYLGLETGALFSLRILFLIALSALLVSTTSCEEMTRGFASVLSPLRFVGIRKKRIADILSMSWLAVPVFWDMARKNIKEVNLKKVRNLSGLITPLSDLITELYLQTEPVNLKQNSVLSDSISRNVIVSPCANLVSVKRG